MTYRHRLLSISVVTVVSMASLLSACSALRLPGLTESPDLATASPPREAADAAPAEQAEPDAVPPKEPRQPDRLYEWQGDGRRVTRLVIDIDQQKARFYDGDDQIGWTTVATGVEAFPTPTGQFEVIAKVADKRSNLYGKIYNSAGTLIKSDARMGRDPVPPGGRFAGAKMPYFLRLTYDGVGLHAGAIPRPGQPASHGCIRLPKGLAPVLFRHVSHGTPVTIVGSGPSYGNYAEKIRIAARERAAAERAAEERATAVEQATTSRAAEVDEDLDGAEGRQEVASVASSTPLPGGAETQPSGADAEPLRSAGRDPQLADSEAGGSAVEASEPAQAAQAVQAALSSRGASEGSGQTEGMAAPVSMPSTGAGQSGAGGGGSPPAVSTSSAAPGDGDSSAPSPPPTSPAATERYGP